jgi:hypothetical protein
MRAFNSDRRLAHLRNGRAGGPQGPALTNLTFPVTINSALKATEAKYPGVEVPAIQDDFDIMGPPDEVFGTTNEQGEIENEGALQFLLNELAKVDLVPNKGKFQAYLANADSCPHNFPMWLKRPFVITCPALRNKVTEAIHCLVDTQSESHQ